MKRWIFRETVAGRDLLLATTRTTTTMITGVRAHMMRIPRATFASGVTHGTYTAHVSLLSFIIRRRFGPSSAMLRRCRRSDTRPSGISDAEATAKREKNFRLKRLLVRPAPPAFLFRPLVFFFCRRWSGFSRRRWRHRRRSLCGTDN